MSVSPEAMPANSMPDTLKLVEVAADSEAYRAQAEDLLATLNRPGQKAANYELAWQTYVTEEENRELARFAALILGAYGYHQYQGELDTIRSGGYDHLQISEQKSYRDQYRYALCQYNHQIRDFILERGDLVSREELEQWMAGASQSEPWAKSVITGAVSEVAVFRALQEDRALKNLRFGSVEEDLAGTDMRAETDFGRPILIDVKSGSHEPVTRKTSHGLKLEISLRHQLLQGYHLTPDAARGVQYLVDLSIKQSQSHQHYHHPRLAAV